MKGLKYGIAMKKTVILLSVLTLLAGGCKPKTTSANMPTTSTQTDTLNIQQELTQEETQKGINREVEKQQPEEEFNYPPVSAGEIARIVPIIKKWTDFYDIDFAKARPGNCDTVCFNCPPSPNDIYYRAFDKEHDTGQRIEVDYSPDKQRYVDLAAIYGCLVKEDGKYKFTGWDDCQAIYLIDRKQKHQNMILWFGCLERAEAVFWESNDVFMIVGYSYVLEPATFFVYVFDIKNQTKNYYTISTEKEYGDSGGYMDEVYWPEKGVIVINE